LLQPDSHHPLTLAPQITTRLKVLAHLDIAERRLPQDGRLTVHVSAQTQLAMRLSTLPSLFGEKIVLRLLDQVAVPLRLNALGLTTEQVTMLTYHVQQQHGLILVTGPTGAGKTITLYSALHAIDAVHVNIATVEDPIELSLTGITQVAVNDKIELSFSRVLRALMRQDPDVLMIGEIRDQDTAENAIKAAQTGHLVLSTLHTDSTTAAISRLLTMGVLGYQIAAALRLVIAQRLARRLCPHCKKPQPLAKAIAQAAGFANALAPSTSYHPVGCDHCCDGYRGRVGIYELLPMTEALRQAILQPQFSATAAPQPSIRLRDAALTLVRQGDISLSEADRVTAAADHGVSYATL